MIIIPIQLIAHSFALVIMFYSHLCDSNFTLFFYRIIMTIIYLRSIPIWQFYLLFLFFLSCKHTEMHHYVIFLYIIELDSHFHQLCNLRNLCYVAVLRWAAVSTATIGHTVRWASVCQRWRTQTRWSETSGNRSVLQTHAWRHLRAV